MSYHTAHRSRPHEAREQPTRGGQQHSGPALAGAHTNDPLDFLHRDVSLQLHARKRPWPSSEPSRTEPGPLSGAWVWVARTMREMVRVRSADQSPPPPREERTCEGRPDVGRLRIRHPCPNPGSQEGWDGSLVSRAGETCLWRNAGCISRVLSWKSGGTVGPVAPKKTECENCDQKDTKSYRRRCWWSWVPCQCGWSRVLVLAVTSTQSRCGMDFLTEARG